MGRRTRLLGLGLGSLLVLLGTAETIRLVSTGDGGLAYWFLTLVGGGSLILLGTARAERQPEVSLAMTVVGCLAGCVPTMWTLVVPLALLLLAVLRLMGPTGTTVTGPGPGRPVGP